MHPLRAFALALLILAGAPAVEASGAVITFEDLDPPGRGTGGLPVNIQYAGQGVTFNDPRAFDYSEGGSALPGFPHSGNVAVEPCVGAEFCSSPVRASFTEGQLRVGVWVGFSFPLSAPLGVRLTAYDGSSAVVGTADATLPARSDPTPIRTPLTVDLGSPVIRSLEVSVTTGGGYTGGLAVDDVEFSTVGPPPPCLATSAPIVTVNQPPAGLEVHNNAFLLQGSVDGGGAPITSASVVAHSPTTRTASVYPALIDADGGPFGPVSFNGLLSAGKNDVVVTATNCRGTGSSASRQVTWSPIPAGTYFRQLGGIEVNQAVQSPDNSVPLIAASGGGVKRTFARVYLRVEGGTSRISGVSGRLTASRPDGSLPGGPATIPSLNTIRVDATTIEDARSDLQSGLIFELPPQWLTEGRLHLELDHLEIEGAQTSMACLGCENPRVPGPPGPALVRFHAVPPLRVWLVSVPYRTATSTNPVAPRQFDFDMLASWLRRAYPSSDVRITQAMMPARDTPPPTCDEVNAQLTFWALLQPGQDWRTRFYGLYDDNRNANFIAGCALIGGPVGSGPTGDPTPRFSWDDDDSYGDWYGGHELGHAYGRLHPGFCGQTDDEDLFPYGGGLIGNERFDNQGIDAGDAGLLLPLQLNDWRAGWSDVMTYCDDEWISAFTYRGILRELCTSESTCPELAEPDGLELPKLERRSSTQARRRGPRLAISGSLSLRSRRVSLGPLAVLPNLTLTPRPRRSRYSIVLLGARKRVLARYPFRPKVESDGPGRRGKARVVEVVRFRPATRRIVIQKGRRTLASMRVSTHAPTVRLLSPAGRRTLRKRVTVRWRSGDADGDRRTYALLYSPGGKRFIPIATGLRKRSFRVDLRRLPGGSRARFRVIATDGVLAGTATSARGLRVPVKRPRVRIATPQTGAELVAGEPIQFVATVSDLQSPRFPASRVLWRSSLQGRLGRGTAIATSLGPGTHEITATATNRGGKTRAARITVSVQAVPPRFDAS